MPLDTTEAQFDGIADAIDVELSIEAVEIIHIGVNIAPSKMATIGK